MITLDALAASDGIRHAFFTREGGVSEGIYASLNCGFGSSDAPENVAANRARAAGQIALEADRLVTCHQIHSAEVVEVTRPWRREDNPRADAMVTRIPGVALGILTADCAPVLLADEAARVVGAAQAGGRGAVGGVIDATIAGMVRLGAEPGRIRAAVGPCIGQRSYEVGPEFPGPFLAEDPENARFFLPAPRAGHFLFDLGGYVEERLRQAGIGSVERAPHDTAAEEERFFSYRRACLRGEKDYGRFLSAIALAE
jgi:YfiH family protein